ncbi:WD repeat-containing protein 20 [Chionoecetes opilio]|uniref:WD repeat-containing protein 20 n=1 Tax=Chionoecetes opilio TaxID=41210 RepID=A0A8J4XN87_CHIOP|nr:WD repeat-containing protein 20 [Chionoecetes opilio]
MAVSDVNIIHPSLLLSIVKRLISQAADLTKPIDKRAYNKEDVPTCHDFNATTASAEGVSLLVGLLGGQIQLIDPITKEVNKAYNAGEPYRRPRSSTVVSSSGGVGGIGTSQEGQPTGNSKCNSVKESVGTDSSHHSHSANSLTAKLANLNFGEKKDKEKSEKEHKRSLSLASKNSTQNCKGYVNKNQSVGSSLTSEDSQKPMGTLLCPRLDECPVLEPMICKKIGHERLSGLVFREDCVITSCQDGCVLTWCRPGKQILLDHVPKVLNWVEVQAVTWPILYEGYHAVIKPLSDRFGSVSRSTVLLKRTGMCELEKIWQMFTKQLQRACWVTFTKRYLAWTDDDWLSVLWSDKATFTVTCNRGARVNRRQGSDPLDSRAFQQDGAPAHTAKSVTQWLDDCMVPFIKDWPGNSLDLNPIENLWHMVKKELQGKDVSSIPKLEKAIPWKQPAFYTKSNHSSGHGWGTHCLRRNSCVA